MVDNDTALPLLPATGPAGSAAIEVARLVKLYKTTRAVDDVSFRISRGSVSGHATGGARIEIFGAGGVPISVCGGRYS